MKGGKKYSKNKSKKGGRKMNNWAKAAGEYYRAHKGDFESFSEVLKSPEFRKYYNEKYGKNKSMKSMKSMRSVPKKVYKEEAEEEVKEEGEEKNEGEWEEAPKKMGRRSTSKKMKKEKKVNFGTNYFYGGNEKVKYQKFYRTVIKNNYPL